MNEYVLYVVIYFTQLSYGELAYFYFSALWRMEGRMFFSKM